MIAAVTLDDSAAGRFSQNLHERTSTHDSRVRRPNLTRNRHVKFARVQLIAGAALCTSVPTRSPCTARSMFPSRWKLNTRIGIFASMQ
jgi:hypothetical protein